jgi:hypothetical protein
LTYFSHNSRAEAGFAVSGAPRYHPSSISHVAPMAQKQPASPTESADPSLSDSFANLDREKFLRNMFLVAGQSQRLIGDFLKR